MLESAGWRRLAFWLPLLLALFLSLPSSLPLPIVDALALPHTLSLSSSFLTAAGCCLLMASGRWGDAAVDVDVDGS